MKTLPFRAAVDGKTRTIGRRRVLLLATLVGVLGVVNLWSSLLARGPGRAALLHRVAHVPLVVLFGSRSLTLLVGVGLLMLARSLARRKRQAWRIAVALLAIAPWTHLAKGLDWEEALLCVALLAALLSSRAAFWASNDPPSARQGIRAALALLAFAVCYGPTGFFLLRREFRPAVNLARAARQTAYLLSFAETRALHAHTRRALWFEESLPLLSAMTVGYAFWMLLRPVLSRSPASEADRRIVRELLRRYGGGPLAAFALLPDKRFLRGDGWAIAYVVPGRIAVALGDPLGDPERVPEAVAAFLDHCAVRDWEPAFYQVTASHLEIYRRMFGLKTVRVGDDAVLDLPSFTLKGKPFQDLRTALNKMARLEIGFEEWQPGDIETLGQMAEVSARWLARQSGPEKTFAMGNFDPQSPLFAESRLFLARQGERLLGFVSVVPLYAPGGGIVGRSLDLMRRADDAPGGLMEFLIASTAQRLQSEGEERLSLGLSPLAEDAAASAECAEDPLVARGRALLFERFHHYYSFAGLHAFKEKFGPRWEPRYLVYPTQASLAAVIYATLRAHSPGNLWARLRKPRGCLPIY